MLTEYLCEHQDQILSGFVELSTFVFQVQVFERGPSGADPPTVERSTHPRAQPFAFDEDGLSTNFAPEVQGHAETP